LLERTRAKIHGLTITELCDAKGWHRGRFYRRTDAAAEKVAVYPNEHGEGSRCRNMNALQQENSLEWLK
jgi:hypothetical protein